MAGLCQRLASMRGRASCKSHAPAAKQRLQTHNFHCRGCPTRAVLPRRTSSCSCFSVPRGTCGALPGSGARASLLLRASTSADCSWSACSAALRSCACTKAWQMLRVLQSTQALPVGMFAASYATTGAGCTPVCFAAPCSCALKTTKAKLGRLKQQGSKVVPVAHALTTRGAETRPAAASLPLFLKWKEACQASVLARHCVVLRQGKLQIPLFCSTVSQ